MATEASLSWHHGAVSKGAQSRAQAASAIQNRALRAGSCVLVQYAVGFSIRLGGNLLLTRLLLPEAFGLMAVVYAIITGLGLFCELGLAQSIVVHPRGRDPAFLNTAWTLQILRGALVLLGAGACSVALAILAAAGFFRPGTVYGDPQLPWIIAVFGASVLLASFESTKLREAQRDLHLARVTMLELVSQGAGLIAMLSLALAFGSVWALVAGALCSGLFKVAGSHLFLTGINNRFAWDRAAAKDLIGFGKWIVVISTLTFAAQSADRIYLGGVAEPSLLGLYATAILLLGAVQTIFWALISAVTFPILSQTIRERRPGFRNVYLAFKLQSDIFLAGTAGLLLVSAPGLVALLYDARYAAVGQILALLAVGLIAMRYAVTEQCYLASSQPRLLAVANLLRATAMFVGLPLGYSEFGLFGAVAAVVAAQFAGWPVAWYYQHRNDILSWKHELVAIPAFLIGMILGALLNVALIAVRHQG